MHLVSTWTCPFHVLGVDYTHSNWHIHTHTYGHGYVCHHHCICNFGTDPYYSVACNTVALHPYFVCIFSFSILSFYPCYLPHISRLVGACHLVIKRVMLPIMIYFYMQIIYIYIYMYIYIYIHTYIYICMFKYLYLYIYVCHISVYVYAIYMAYFQWFMVLHGL